MSLIVTILLLGLMASLSPTTIVVFILVLATTKARANAAAFLIGWSVSLVVVFTVSYEIGAARATQEGAGHAAVEAGELLLGVGLLFIARRQWRRRGLLRPQSGISSKMSARFQRLNPWEAAIVGVLKEPWTLTAAAAVVVVRHHGSLLTALIALAVFTAVSTATVGLTYLYYARRPGEAEGQLEALRDRMVASGPTIMAVVSAIVGGYLIADSVIGLIRG